MEDRVKVVVKDFVQKMSKWELDACKLLKRELAGELSSQECSQAVKSSYDEIADAYGTPKAKMGIAYGDPPTYDPTETFLEVKVGRTNAEVLTQQHHQEDEEDNYKVLYKLKLIDGAWRIDARYLIDSDGERFNVGI